MTRSIFRHLLIPFLMRWIAGHSNSMTRFFFDKIRQAQGPVLELGCGRGRVTIPLAQRGIEMTGLELSTPSLDYARQQSGALPIRWVEADVRDFHLGMDYALIFARGGVFSFMLTRFDQEAMLACVREHMNSKSQFMLDICYIPPDSMVETLDEVEWYTATDPQGRRLYVSGTDRYDHQRQVWIQTCTHRLDNADGEVIAPPWELTLRYQMPQEVEAILHYNGFKVVDRYADWEGTPVTEKRPAEIFICEKR